MDILCRRIFSIIGVNQHEDETHSQAESQCKVETQREAENHNFSETHMGIENLPRVFEN